MGGRAGGGAGMGWRSGGLQSGATERGMSRQLAKSVLDKENNIKNNPSESLHVFDDNGKEIYQAFSKPGRPYEVEYDGKAVKDKVVTHNHPRALGKTGVESFGSSLGGADLTGIVRNNMKEMRAIYPTFTYSMTRPKGGWGVTEKQFISRYKAASRKLQNADSKFLATYKGSGKQWWAAASRLENTFYHRLNKQIAKDFGWTYTKKKNK